MAQKQEHTEDNLAVVEETLTRTEKFIEENQKVISLVVGAIVVVVLGYFALQRYYFQPQEQEAASQMFMAEKYFEKDSLDKALNGDATYPGFLQIIDDYGMTKSANLAKYYVGVCYLQKGEYESAIEYLSDFSCDAELLAPAAKAAIGDAYMQLGNQEKALSNYLSAAGMKENNLTTPQYLLKAAQTFELLNKNSSAIELYEQIRNDYPTSAEFRDAEKFLARAQAKAGK